MATDDLDDFRWLVSDAATRWLAQVEKDDRSTVAIVKLLRKDLTAGRAHLVMEQVELRRRAKNKFPEFDAARMFFTRKLLEQSSDAASASHKARRFAPDAPTADLCCGIGGDLLALARQRPCVGVDRDPVAALLADANCRALGMRAAVVRQANVREFDLRGVSAWHLDPDRRTNGRRSIRPELWEPDRGFLEKLVVAKPSGAIKLAPATPLPDDLARTAECEWIGVKRECRQQIAWFGGLARHSGWRTATIVSPIPSGNGARGESGQEGNAVSIHGRPNQEVPVASAVGRFIGEPHPTVLAAGLTGALAQRDSIRAVAGGIAYLTADEPFAAPMITSFEVMEVLPFDLKRVKAAIRRHAMGRLEIKHRGIRIDPEELQRRLAVVGKRAGCLIVWSDRSRAKAVLATRYEANRAE